jgi:outer membrane biosynthesis protein TonB
MVINFKKGVLMAFVSSSAVAIPGAGAFPPDHRAHGAQSLLSGKPPKQHYTAQGIALALYALLIGAALTTAFKPAQVVTEEEQTVELAPMPVDEEPPPPPDQAPIEQPQVDDTPPPPMALDPIAPIEEAKPTPKPIEKVEKKVDKPVERKQTAAPRAAVPVARAPAAPPGAQVSEIANHFHACMQRAAANAYPESQAPRTAHISYHATFGPSGSLSSYSISGSGNAAFDAVAQRLGARCGSVPAPGKPVSLSGSLTFSP